MPTRNISLTDQLDQYVEQRRLSGNFENASEVVRAALSRMKADDERQAAWLDYLRKEAAEGFAEIERGEYVTGTPREIMAGIVREFGL